MGGGGGIGAAIGAPPEPVPPVAGRRPPDPNGGNIGAPPEPNGGNMGAPPEPLPPVPGFGIGGMGATIGGIGPTIGAPPGAGNIGARPPVPPV